MLGTICHGIERCMPLIILGVAAACLLFPACGLWVDPSAVGPLLAVIMFCMGLHLRVADFKMLALHPRDILLGCAAQFTIMPALAYALGKLLGLEPALMAGLVLVGTCPGGTASNVITFLARGDVALSVGMTTVNTLLAPVLTPLVTWLLLRTTVEVEPWEMMLSIALMVIVPIGLGMLCSRYAARHPGATALTPTLAVLAICAIVACVVSHQAGQILHSGCIILLAVVLHNVCGFGCGFLLSRLLRFAPAKAKAITIEIGMQNSGLATALAQTNMPQLAMATVPGALFSVWHNLSGGLLAAIFRHWGNDDEK